MGRKKKAPVEFFPVEYPDEPLADDPLDQLAIDLFMQGPMPVSEICDRLLVSAGEAHELLEKLNSGGSTVEIGPHQVVMRELGWRWWRVVLEKKSQILKRDLGQNTLVYDRIGSTNDVCMQVAAGQATIRPLVVLADEQQQGRGRRGHRWMAAAGQSVLMSVLLPNVGLCAEALTLAAGVACAVAVEKLTDGQVTLKWPNDLLLDGKKLAGILIESVPGGTAPEMDGGDGAGARHYVIGVGLNVRQDVMDFPEELRSRATSLLLSARHLWDRLVVIDALVEELDLMPTRLNDPRKIADEWKARCDMLGEPVRLLCNGVAIEGHIADIDPLNGLVVRDFVGALHFCQARESTLLS